MFNSFHRGRLSVALRAIYLFIYSAKRTWSLLRSVLYARAGKLRSRRQAKNTVAIPIYSFC